MRSERGPLRRYGFAVAAVACALVLTPPLRDRLEPMPGALFAAAVLGSAWYGGVGPGLFAVLLSLLGAAVFRTQPQTKPPDAAGLAGGVLFLLMTALLGWQSSASRRARAAVHLLAGAGKSLAASLDYETTLAAAARLAVPDLADACVVDLVADDGGLWCAAAAHADPVLETKLRLAAQNEAPSPAAPRGVAWVVRLGRPLACPRLPAALVSEVVPEAARRQALRALGARSLLIVPLRARDRTLGALTLLSARRWRRFGRADLTLAGELAQRAALALDNARLYRQARDMEAALRSRAEQLTAADRVKDEFLAVVAHELRGPLGALRSALEVLRRHDPAAPPGDAPEGIMTRQVEALARLVDDLLDVSRITQGKITLARRPLDLNEVIRAAVATTRPLLDERRHALAVHLPPDGLHIYGDPLRLEQVFVNLLTNAAKYTEPGGQVWVSARLDEGAEGARRAVVAVRDTGMGMTAEFLGRAFDLFAQAPGAPGRSQGGLGIGLSLVRRLVEMHGGSVEAHSAGPGRGSELVVRLPLRKGEAGGARAEGQERRALPHAQGPPRRVLVVDDNADAAEGLALLLRLRGHEVRVAPDGEAALEVLNGAVPDVVLCDLGLPGIDGHEVGRRARQQSALDRTLLVALTGSESDDDRRRAREVGFDHYLVKPVDPEDLDRVLREGRR